MKAYQKQQESEHQRHLRFAYNIAALSGKAFAGKLEKFEREFPDKPAPLTPKTMKDQQQEFEALSKALDARDRERKAQANG